MTHSDNRRRGILQGRSVFLSASVPTRPGFRRPSFAAVEIEEAVVSLARAVLREEGVLVFGAHPSISPLVASVAGEYITPHLSAGEAVDLEKIVQPERRGPGVVIYQSHAYDGYVPDKTWELYRLGYAELIWCNAQGGERFDPTLERAQCFLSLEFMRKAMIQKERPIAMVAIGGMEGVIDEAEIFLSAQEDRNIRTAPPVWILKTTGGAAEQLAERFIHQRGRIRFIEQEWRDANPEATSMPLYEAGSRAESFVPYPTILQWLVRQIAKQP